MNKKWPNSCEQIVNEVDAEYDIGWDTDATLSLLSLFIQQVSTPKRFRYFLEAQANREKEISED